MRSKIKRCLIAGIACAIASPLWAQEIAPPAGGVAPDTTPGRQLPPLTAPNTPNTPSPSAILPSGALAQPPQPTPAPATPAQPGAVIVPDANYAIAPVAVPQDQFVFPEGYGYPFLMNPLVVQSLDLPPRLTAQLNRRTIEIANQYREQLNGLNALPAAQRELRAREIQNTMNADMIRQAVGLGFKPEQIARVRQLELQQRGLNAFLDGGVQNQLNLTPTQLRQMEALRATTDKDFLTIRQLAAQNREEAIRRYDALQQQNATRVNDILTQTQRQNWNSMTGAQFKFAPPFVTAQPAQAVPQPAQVSPQYIRPVQPVR